jgi:CRISPR-associated protein Cmr1
MADWEGGREFGYALFPLQRSEGERRGQRAPFPTRRVRNGLSFRLVVGLRTGARCPSEDEMREPLRQVLASLWAWIHLGGIGGRTRRGFGALELTAAAQLGGFPAGLEELAREWRGLLTPAGEEEFSGHLERFERAAGASAAAWPPALYAGRAGTAIEAHRGLLGCLRDFRQKPDFARDAGNPPGRSRWPEPNLLRLLRDAGANWEHPIPDEVREQAEQLGAPRAAFGLPIVMPFKTDRGRLRADQRSDEFANGQLLPAAGDRWASPLLMRPVRWQHEDYRPLVVVLGNRFSGTVRIRFEKDPKRDVDGVAVERSAGARGEIHHLLTQHAGRALEAFAAWLVAKQGYRPVPATSQTGPPGGRNA